MGPLTWPQTSVRVHWQKLLENYNKPYIYCINTSNKRININNTIFADWDDLDNIDLNKMKDFNIASTVNNIHKKTDKFICTVYI